METVATQQDTEHALRLTGLRAGDSLLDLRDGPFDGEQMRTVREIVRATEPGGRVVLIAYGAPAECEALQLFLGALLAVVTPVERLPDAPPPLEFQMSDPRELRRRLIDAGLRDVLVDTTQRECIEISSGEQLWDWCLDGNRIPRTLVADLSERQRGTVREVLDGLVRERSNANGPAVLTAPLNIGIGSK